MPSRRDADVAIRCSDLSIARVSRGTTPVRVVDGVSFTLGHSAALTLMGPTGAGKSTLAAVLAGSDDSGVAVVGGSAFVDGIAVRRAGRAHRMLTYIAGYLPQSAGAMLPARLTVGEVIADPVTSRDRRVSQRALSLRVASLLDELMLPLGSASKYPYELSAGMRQRVALARAFMLQPKVLIADDPFANLDVEVRAAARDAILRRRDEYGMSALVVSNNADVARELSAAVLVMRGGHAVGYGRSADELLWTPSEGVDRRLAAS